MSDDRYYPEIDPKPLDLVKRLFEADPGYFSDPDCPYPDSIKGIFVAIPRDEDALDVNNIEIEGEIDKLITDIKEWGESLNPEDKSEKAAYFRVSYGLIEKLISLKERVYNMAQVREFTRTVLQIMQDELPVDLRQAVIDRLKVAAEN